MRKISASAILLFSGDAIARLLGFYATAYLARVLGAAGFGVIGIGMGVLAYALGVADLGLTTIGTRELAKPPAARGYGLGDFLLVKLALAVVVFVIALGLIQLLPYGAEEQSVARLYLLSLFAWAMLLEWYFQAIHSYLPGTLSKIVSGGLYLGLVYMMVRGRGDLPMVPIYYVVANLAGGIVILFMRRREDRLVPARPEWKRYAPLLRSALPVGVGGILAQGVQSLPLLALGYFGSTADAGILNAALKIVFLVLMLDRVFIALFLPRISRLWASDPERLEETLGRVLRLVIVSAASFSTVVALFSESIIVAVFGEGYRAGALPLSILSWFIAATLVNTPVSYTLIAIGQERSYFRVTLISGLVSVALILFMTWLWGTAGAAIAMIASELCMLSMMYLEFRKHFRTDLLRTVATAALLSLLLTLAAGSIGGLHHLWQAPLVWLLFIALSVALRGISAKELTVVVKG
jgi:PST family polysaccharide transporter